MRKQSLIQLGAFLSAVCLLTGCRQSATPAQTPITSSAPPVSAPVAPTPPPSTASKTPIKDSVDALLTQQSSDPHPVFPAGTKLLHADLKEGVVTLDFSSEFNQLSNMGDSVEGAAQKSLCAAIAPIPGVEKLRVTVEGKKYESQMADWDTPFPVRDRTAASPGDEGKQE